MFRRRDSQKPTEEFYADFKANSNFNNAAKPLEQTVPPTPQVQDAMDGNFSTNMDQAQFHERDTSAEHESSSSVSAAEWRVTPTTFGPTSSGMSGFLHDMSSTWWQPTPTSETAVFANGPEDLNVPGLTPSLSTPVSRHHSDSALYGTQMGGFAMQDFHGHHATYGYQSQSNFDPSASFAPHQLHHDMSYEASVISHHHPQSAVSMHGYAAEYRDHSHPSVFLPQLPNKHRNKLPLPEGAEQFRFQTILNTKTAMIKDPNEIPITYLNKSQAYTISIRDAFSQHVSNGMTRYRTFVRVSFEDEQQRARPDHCWGLWSEGRGINESRGGNLRAVEYVSPSQTQRDDRVSSVMLEDQRLDGFIVTWTPPAGTSPECLVSLRFNFLSTDFSHSKGVKGIPVRLCAKTSIANDTGDYQDQEVCYCKVKLFRDHGAERKLANDKQHVDKNIKKLQQQLQQTGASFTPSGKRRRSDSVAQGMPPAKIRHKRTRSLSSNSSAGEISSAEDDMHQKIDTLTQMTYSQRDQSVFFLRGEPEDDPDTYPVSYTNATAAVKPFSLDEFNRPARRDTQVSGMKTESPTPSSRSQSSSGRQEPGLQYPTPMNAASRVASNDWIPEAKRKPTIDTKNDFGQPNPQHLASPPDLPLKIPRLQSSHSGESDSMFEAIGLDPSYQPPPERHLKPIACFYIQPKVADRKAVDKYYRALYLYERTLQEFVHSAASKSDVDSSMVRNVVRVNNMGILVKVDDDVIREMPEGQDMLAEFEPVDATTPTQESRGTDAGYTLTLRY